MDKKTKKAHQLSQAEILKAIPASHERIKDWSHFHSVLETMRDTGWIFRGVASPNHYPVPSIGREKQYGHYKRAPEERLFEEFKLRAVSIMTDPQFTEWDWLAFAQHVGVPTRLVDWSVSPLIAAFFALEADNDEDRVIYAVKYSRFIHEVERHKGPFDNTVEGRFTAPLAFDRIRAQRGIFTIHPDPTKIFWPRGMRSLLISNAMVVDFRKRLFKYGVDHWLIYPDMHGLGQQLKWQLQYKVGLGGLFMKKAKTDSL